MLGIALLSQALYRAVRSSRSVEAAAPAPSPFASVPVQGSLEVGPDGHFRPGPETVRAFGYFALLLNGQPTPVVRERIAAYAREKLAPPAADEAIDVLDRYLRMQERTLALGPGPLTLAGLRERFAQVRQIRRDELGAALASAMFGAQDRVLELELERRAVLSDASLATDERERRIAELDRNLPAEERAARERAAAPLRLRNEVEQMRSSGASDQEIFAYRERQIGRDAAERLADVDRRRALWKEHWESYGQERARILRSSTSLAPDARDALLEPLRRRHFSYAELSRARYLDQLELHPAE